MDPPAHGAEVLGTDDPPAGRRRPALPGGRRLVVPLVVAAVLLVVADGAQGRRETDQLLTRVAAGEAAATYADRRLSGTVEYTSSQLSSPQVPAAVRAGLRRLVEGEAAGQVPALRRARVRLAAVRVLPWHEGQRQARAASVRLLDARTRRLQEVSRDLDRLYVRGREPDASARAARRALGRVASPRRVAGALPAS
jgi:hypothetical protein